MTNRNEFSSSTRKSTLNYVFCGDVAQNRQKISCHRSNVQTAKPEVLRRPHSMGAYTDILMRHVLSTFDSAIDFQIY